MKYRISICFMIMSFFIAAGDDPRVTHQFYAYRNAFRLFQRRSNNFSFIKRVTSKVYNLFRSSRNMQR